jgi:CBS domain-containing membrane protein
MGASAVILFLTPNSQFAKHWPLLGGHIFSALVGVSCAISIHDNSLAAATAVGGSILLMQLLRCMNPPGAATALAPVVAPLNSDLFSNYFILAPVTINVLVMLLFSLLIHWLFRFGK